ncbi:hypothetical protein D3C80_1722010 [compost metagenome]
MQRLGEGKHKGFGRRINGGKCRRHQGRDRGDIDDRALSICCKTRCDRRCKPGDGKDIEIDHRRDMGRVQFRDSAVSGNTGIVDETGDPPVLAQPCLYPFEVFRP